MLYWIMMEEKDSFYKTITGSIKPEEAKTYAFEIEASGLWQAEIKAQKENPGLRLRRIH